MTDAEGWQPLSKPRRRARGDAFHLSPFARLARTHSLTAMADALVAVALAGSVFFDIDNPDAAKSKVLLYLILTAAPLAFVAPFIGPALDRSHGGRRWMVVAVNGVRALVCLVMLDDLKSLLLFPEAFVVLALGKAYGVARSALVPTVVRNDAELVEANSKLQMLSGLAAPAAGLVAGPAYLIAGSQGVLGMAMVVYLASTVAALRIPATQVAVQPVTAQEAAELRSVGVLLAASAVALIRGIVGFITLLLVFDLREEDRWKLGLVAGATGAGALIGSALAPRLRRSLTEERMIMVLLGATVVVGGAAAWIGGLGVSALMAGTVAVVATCGKLAFDSLVQRDAPDANRGRSFARFEVRFQMVWVLGALIPLAPWDLPVQVGFAGIALTAGFALFSYVTGQRAAHREHAARPRSEGTPFDQDALAPLDPTSSIPLDDPDGDPAGWRVADPAWGPDPTRVDPDRTRVQGYGDADPW